MIWAAISWYSAGPIINFNGRITATDYVDILGHQMHPMVQMLLPNKDAIFKVDISLIRKARSVQSWFQEHEDALHELSWPDLSIVEPLWSIFDGRVRSRIPPLSISQATRRRAVQYSSWDHSELIRDYSKKDTSSITGKWWPNSVVIKKCISVTTVSIILSIHCRLNREVFWKRRICTL
jgi:hypothetical protein